MDNRYNLRRFLDVQDLVFADVRRELSAGRKQSHWMWFIFPQIAGLGTSEMARRYAIETLHEAKAYLVDPILGPRLVEVIGLVNAVNGKSANEIFGSPDDMKFHSSLTLFIEAGGGAPFQSALVKYFDGKPDRKTLEILGKP